MVEVKKAAIEIRYINFQIYICYNAYRQERIIISPEKRLPILGSRFSCK